MLPAALFLSVSLIFHILQIRAMEKV